MYIFIHVHTHITMNPRFTENLEIDIASFITDSYSRDQYSRKEH